MKKILSILAITALVTFASAQDLKNTASANKVTVPVLISAAANHTSAEYLNNISPKAVGDLEKKFKNVNDVNWHMMDYGFRAKFKLNDVSYRVDYDKKGNWMDMIRTYDQKHLPTATRSMIKSAYYDYSIVMVEEVSKLNNEMTYIVHLESDDDWLNVRVQNGEMDEWQRINKAK